MARINIESKLFQDARYTDLCISVGNRECALGALVSAWMLAQTHHSLDNVRCLIPLDEWRSKRMNDAVIASGLAVIEGESVYVRGVVEQFNWLTNAKASGSKGGKAKREATLKPPSSNPIATPPRNVGLPKRSLPSSSYSSSLDLLDSEEPSKEYSARRSAKPTGQQVVQLYCDLWKERTKNPKSPSITGADAGKLKRLASDIGFARTCELLRCYFSMPDPWFVTHAYPIGIFISSLRKVEAFESSGRVVTKRSIAEFEEAVDDQQQTGHVDFRAIAEAEQRRDEEKQRTLSGGSERG